MDTTKSNPLFNGVTFTVQRDLSADGIAEMADFLLHHPDVFGTNYIGYWAYGIPLRDPNYRVSGWLVCEMHDEVRPTANEAIAIEAHFKATGERKFDYKGQHNFTVHLLDETAVIDICKQLAIGNINSKGDPLDYDGHSLDYAIQVSLLGSQVYG